MTPDLRGDRAQGLHIFELKFEEAESELILAPARESQNRGSIHPAGRSLRDHETVRRGVGGFGPSVRGRRALADIAGGRNPGPMLPGRVRLAVTCGKKALDLHPYFSLGRSHCAQALEFAGRLDEALIEYRLACVMSPDFARLRAEEARCLARTGAKTRRRKSWEISKIFAGSTMWMHIRWLSFTMHWGARSGIGRTRKSRRGELTLSVHDGYRSAARRPSIHPRFTRLRNRIFRDHMPGGALPSGAETERDSVVNPDLRAEGFAPSGIRRLLKQSRAAFDACRLKLVSGYGQCAVSASNKERRIN